jgi:hypothetical protein
MLVVASQAPAQSAPSDPAGPAAPVLFPTETSDAPHALWPGGDAPHAEGGPLSGNHNFPNFIGFISNPLQNIDPRAVTAIYPIFGSAWVSNTAPIPDADGQIYGPAITVALSDRLAVGLNQGGWADLHISRNQLARDQRFRDLIALLDPQGRFRDVEAGGDRDGWLNIGGFLQYTVIEDVEDQFLLTAGVRWVAPCGSHEVFQGRGPALMAPYFTAGKELGEFHVLATGGFQFPFAGSGKLDTDVFYANVHLDRRCFDWLYPLIEFNWSYHTTSVNFALPTRRGLIDFDNFEATGNILTMSVGANAVLIKERLEVGAVYTTELSSQRNFEIDGLLVKMMLRF